MPFAIHWHPSLPVLLMTYSGVVSAEDYTAMCTRRRQMLDEHGGQVVLVVDVQAMETFMGDSVRPCENILLDERIVRAFIVLPQDLYRKLSRNFRHTPRRALRAAFFDSLETALAEAESLAGSLA